MLPIALNKTVQGSNHEARGEACEDASGIFEDEGIVVFAVADGHGEKTCARSKDGAELAVAVSCRLLVEFAKRWDSYDEILGDEQSIADLKCHLVDVWLESIEDDIASNPITDEESLYLERRKPGQAHAHLYGTTLLAGVFANDYLLILQQGDGACALVDEVGTCRFPIPQDYRCIGNTTTSMADHDAAGAMRHHLLSLNEQGILACLVMTDGVDKSLRGEEGLQDFSYWLVQQAQGVSRSQVKDALARGLQSLSAAGSGDDASVAGFINGNVSGKVLHSLGEWREQYELISDIDESRSRLVSMSRKLKHLETLCMSGDEAMRDEYEAYRASYNEVSSRVQELEQSLVELCKQRTSEAVGNYRWSIPGV